jgi:tRNA threonylcarbamoyladenosine dehydratase
VGFIKSFYIHYDRQTLTNTPKLTEYGAADDVFSEAADQKRQSDLAARARQGDYDETLILEQLARNRVFLTDDGLARLRKAFIIVVGCGGVGSHCVAALARSGVSRIRLVDFDQVTLSSLNRHAVATLADVGTPKVHCLRRRLEQVVPWCHFECWNEMFREEEAARLLGVSRGLEGEGEGWKPDYVVDAIDNIDSKVALLKYCREHELKVVSSMGAGCKSDPTRVLVGDISASIEDPLSRATRRRLRAKGVESGIPCVFSTEKPGPGKAELLPLPQEEFEKGGVGELGVMPDFRIRILPVLGTMPAFFGLTVANHVILEITGYPHEYLASKAREKMYDGIQAQVQGLEERLARSQGFDAVGLKVPVTLTDVGYLIEEVYYGRSVISGIPTRLALARWRKPEDGWVDLSVDGQKRVKLDLSELVCMTKEEMQKHEKEVLKGTKSSEEVYDKAVLELVERRMEEEKQYSKWR